MKVLLSIKPEYVKKIFSGEKKYEFRRNIFKRKEIDTIVIYSTSPEKKIVGEFKIDEVIEENPEKLWNLFNDFSGIKEKPFKEYFKGKEKGYAIKIGKVKKYKNFKTLKDYSIDYAPQSFLYLNK